MGIYVDGGPFDYPSRSELFRQAAVDRARPLRLRGEPALDRIVRAAAAAYSTSGAAISIIDRDSQVFLTRVGTDLWSTARDGAICDLTIQRVGETTVIYDAEADPEAAGRLRIGGITGVRFYAGSAIVDGAGYALGALCVFDAAPRAHVEDMTVLASLAREAERIVCP